MKKIVFSLLMLVPFGLVSCFSGASESSTEEIETQKMQQQVDSLYKKMSQAERVCSVVWYPFLRGGGEWKIVFTEM